MASKREEFSVEVLQLGSSDSRWYYLIHPRKANKLIAFKSCESQSEAADAASKALEALSTSVAGKKVA